MKNLLKAIITTVLFSSFSGCGKNIKIVVDEPGLEKKTEFSIQNLKDKSSEEVLKIKYDKAILSCNLWIQFGKQLNKNLKPNDTFSLDLLNTDISRESTQQLSGQVKNKTLEITINLKNLSIKNIKFEDNLSKSNYVMENSPVIEMDLDYKSYFNNGWKSLKSSGHHTRKIHEKIRDLSFSHSSITGNKKKKYFDHIECTIDTDIKSEYQDQFIVK